MKNQKSKHHKLETKAHWCLGKRCLGVLLDTNAFLFGLACVLLVNFSLLFCVRAIFGDSLIGSVIWGISAGAFSGLFPPSFFIKHLGARSKKTERENVQNGVLP